MASNTTQIDNADARVVYSGTWSQHIDADAFNNTYTLTRSMGSTATLTFTGNSVAVYGPLGPHPTSYVAPPITKYQVDDSEPTTYAPPSPSQDIKRTLFFQSQVYPYGEHKLVMTNMVEKDWIWLDYFEVINTGGPPPAPTSGMYQFNTFDLFLLIPERSPPGTSGKASVGLIVGAILGALVGVAIIIGAIFLLFRRRKKKKAALEADISIDDLSASYSPFITGFTGTGDTTEQSGRVGELVSRGNEGETYYYHPVTPNYYDDSTAASSSASIEHIPHHASGMSILPGKRRVELAYAQPEAPDAALPPYST